MGFTASLMYWPLVNTVMYSMVQPRFFNLYADTASLLFASIMSYITYKDCQASSQTEVKLAEIVPKAAPLAVIEKTQSPISWASAAFSTWARI